MIKFDFIDIGCGTGGSIGWANGNFGGPDSKYLGIDNREHEVSIARKAGLNVILQDVTEESYELPKCKFITMLHVLEHLKSEQDVENVIKKSIDAASDFIFMIVPSFDSKEYLKELGFKLTWTDWIGHSTAVTSDMFRRIAHKLGVEAIIKQSMPVHNTISEEIIPFDAPVDSIEYSKNMGKKEYAEFKNVYRETWCIINLNCPNWNDIKDKINLMQKNNKSCAKK